MTAGASQPRAVRARLRRLHSFARAPSPRASLPPPWMKKGGRGEQKVMGGGLGVF